MTDRELLEMAAKAAGMDGCAAEFGDPNRLVFLPDGMFIEWDPLTDDGDALRLAVKLSLCITHYGDEVVAGNEKGTILEDVNRVGNLYAATRRAIVRAAAEIGKNL